MHSHLYYIGSLYQLVICSCKLATYDACRECIGALLQASRTGSASQLVCPLCRAKVQGQDLVKGVNEGAQALEEEDSFTTTLEEQASTSESKLNALLEEVLLHVQLQNLLPVMHLASWWREHYKAVIVPVRSLCGNATSSTKLEPQTFTKTRVLCHVAC